MGAQPVRGAELQSAFARRAEAAGLNLVGCVDTVEFDATQPRGQRAAELRSGCGTLVVLATGGRRGWAAMIAASGRPPGPPRATDHPIDAWSRDVAIELQGWLADHGVEARGECVRDTKLNLRQLGEMAGLGTISPVIEMLMHPEFGPWVSVRGVLLVDGQPFGPQPSRPTSDYQPCEICTRPCLQACPGEALSERGMDFVACGSHRHRGGCAESCDVRRACPQGADHRYTEADERHRHQHATFMLRKAHGLGLWSIVPPRFRR